MALGSCGSEEPISRVALRLDATFFAEDPSAVLRHRPVIKIGNEGREVVLASARAWSHQWDNVSFENGVARLELPEGVRISTHGVPQVSVLRIPRIGEGKPRVEDWALSWVRLDEGWTLQARDDEPAMLVLELRQSPEDIDRNVSVRIEAFERPPAETESRPFELDRGARIDLAYAWQWPPASPAETLERRAFLRCEHGGEIELLERKVRGDSPEAKRWNEATVSTGDSSGKCTLRLSSRGSGGPVWATPRVLGHGEMKPGGASNLLMICLDTLAARHLQAYGYRRRTSPEIDGRLIERGTLFTSASTTFPRTDRAHIGLFTSLYASSYPHEPRYIGAGDAAILLAESFRDAGFETGAVTEDGLIAGALGFWHGFDRYIERTTQGGDAVATFADATKYLRAHRDRRFFLFVHTYQVHAPWNVAAGYRELFRDDGDPALRRVPKRFREQYDDYDRSIVETDELVGGLLDELDRLDLAKRTLVVLLSDHGEAFGEHGAASHGFTGHDEEILIPLVFRGPGVLRGARVKAPVSIIDVAPTVLDYFGLPSLPQAQGVSLLAGLKGERLPPDREIFFEWIGGNAGVRVGNLKLLDVRSRYKGLGFNVVKEPESSPALFFDVKTDPDETNPRMGQTRVRESLREAVARFRESTSTKSEALRQAGAASAAPHSIGQDVIRSLRALGYLE